MGAYRVGVVGLGRGKRFVELFNALPDCDVVAVCDPLPKTLAAFPDVAAHTDYGRFLGEGLDIVAVISPGPVHAEQSVAALKAGAHVLCETPCVYSVEEARQVAAATAETRGKYMLAEDYIWRGWAVHLKRQADEGMFGEIVYAEGDYTHDCRDLMLADENGFVPYAERDRRPNAKKTWRATDLPPIYYTSHTLGPLLHVMDDRIVSAVGMSAGSRCAPELGTIDLEAALFETEKGSIVRLTNGFTVAHPYALYYNLVGTRGSAKFMQSGKSLFVWYSDTADTAQTGWLPAPNEWLERPHGPADPVAAMVEEFVDSIRNDTAPPVDLSRSFDFVLPGIVAHDSARTNGEKLVVPKVG